MIIASGTRTKPDGTEQDVIVLGITEANIEKMREGQPMQIDSETHQGWTLGNTTLLIIHGLTERSLYQAFVENGLIGADTKVILTEKDR